MAECLDRWDLSPGLPFENSVVSVVVPVERNDGSEAVLKLQFPHRESDEEALALQLWDGKGAIRLLDHSPDVGALLLERCRPGEPLSSRPEADALDVLCSLLERTWIPATEVRSLAEEVPVWVSSLERRLSADDVGFDHRLTELAIEVMLDLVATQPDAVLVHQDLHGENVISAKREPWLIIDPKPLSAERALGLAPVIASHEFGHSREDVHWRVNTLVDRLGVDRERSIGWAFARTVAWAIKDPHVNRRHVETARWLEELL